MNTPTPNAIISQPDSNGEFSSPLDGALWMASFGIPQTPLKGKRPFLDGWQKKSSTDPEQLRAWAREFTGCNFGSVALPGGFFIFETDSGEVRKRAEDIFIAKLMVESSKADRGHRYYKWVEGVENIAQNGTAHGDFSLRVDGEQCVSPGSIHPETGSQYRVRASGAPEPPAAQELGFWKSEKKTENKAAAVTDEPAPIPQGQRNSTITSILGKARQATGAGYEVLLALAHQHNQRCQPPLGASELETIAGSIAKYAFKPEPELLVRGVPIEVLAEQQRQAQVQAVAQVQEAVANWRSKFRNIAEMEQGDPVMIIEGVLQDGTCFLGAAPGHGKTLVALAMAKAITLGTNLFELPEFSVKKPYPVIYLIPETSDRPFRRRCEAFRIPADDRFIARTITEGASLKLTDPELLEAVRQLKPVVILDTARRFNNSSDTNSDAQNQKLVNNVIELRAAGAVCIIILHHATKAANHKKEMMTLENMLSGTGDFGAMCDQAYGIRMDENLYNRGSGSMEIEIVNLKDRERVGGLSSLRVAATYKKEGHVFPRSWIDETGNFRTVGHRETMERNSDTLVDLVQSHPDITIMELVEETGIKKYTVQQLLKGLGWHRLKGGSNGSSPWHQDLNGTCPYEKPEPKAVKPVAARSEM